MIFVIIHINCLLSYLYEKANWKPFYQHSLLLFQFLEEHTDKLFLEAERKSLNYAEDSYGIYSTAQNSGYASLLPVAPRFMHTICQLHTVDDLSQFEALLQRYQTLYTQALQKDRAEVRFPFIMPRLLDEQIYQININSSKAFSSKAHHPKDGPLCLQTWAYDADDYASFEQAFNDADVAITAMKEAGFPVLLREVGAKGQSLLCLDLDVAALCQQLECEHLQQRIPTGTQYKAQLMYHNQDTVRDSLGVFVLRPGQVLTLYHAIPHKTRKDALFVEGHPDEIRFPIQVTGQFYKKYLKK